MSHECVSGMHMMSPPPQAIEPIEPSSILLLLIFYRNNINYLTHTHSLHNIYYVNEQFSLVIMSLNTRYVYIT